MSVQSDPNFFLTSVCQAFLAEALALYSKRLISPWPFTSSVLQTSALAGAIEPITTIDNAAAISVTKRMPSPFEPNSEQFNSKEALQEFRTVLNVAGWASRNSERRDARTH